MWCIKYSVFITTSHVFADKRMQLPVFAYLALLLHKNCKDFRPYPFQLNLRQC